MTSRLYLVFWILISSAVFAPLAAAVYDAATPVEPLHSRSGGDSAVPLIRAPEEPVKIRPPAHEEVAAGSGEGKPLAFLESRSSASEQEAADPPPPLPPPLPRALERAFRHALANPPDRSPSDGR